MTSSAPRAILFDAYGTLFRLDGIAPVVAGRLGLPTGEAIAARWRAKQLEISLHRSLMGERWYVDFATITAEALAFVLDAEGLSPPAEVRARLREVWTAPPADPAAGAVLAALAPVPRAILSNGAPAMLRAAVAAAGLGDSLEALLSADVVRRYKPHPDVYALGPDRFGGEPEEFVFVTANGWDAAGAAAFGYRVCWINRTGAPVERHGPPPEWMVESLTEVPAAVRGAK